MKHHVLQTKQNGRKEFNANSCSPRSSVGSLRHTRINSTDKVILEEETCAIWPDLPRFTREELVWSSSALFIVNLQLDSATIWFFVIVSWFWNFTASQFWKFSRSANEEIKQLNAHSLSSLVDCAIFNLKLTWCFNLIFCIFSLYSHCVLVIKIPKFSFE